jgi:hypothetical protein
LGVKKIIGLNIVFFFMWLLIRFKSRGRTSKSNPYAKVMAILLNIVRIGHKLFHTESDGDKLYRNIIELDEM